MIIAYSCDSCICNIVPTIWLRPLPCSKHMYIPDWGGLGTPHMPAAHGGLYKQSNIDIGHTCMDNVACMHANQVLTEEHWHLMPLIQIGAHLAGEAWTPLCPPGRSGVLRWGKSLQLSVSSRDLDVVYGWLSTLAVLTCSQYAVYLQNTTYLHDTTVQHRPGTHVSNICPTTTSSRFTHKQCRGCWQKVTTEDEPRVVVRGRKHSGLIVHAARYAK